MSTAHKRSGFTLVEVMISSALLGLVTAGVLSFYVLIQRMWASTTRDMSATAEASSALDYMVYGVQTNDGLRQAFKNTISVSTQTNGWYLYYGTNNSQYFRYRGDLKRIENQNGTIVCKNLSNATLTQGIFGVSISLQVLESGGGATITSRMTTYVAYRN